MAAPPGRRPERRARLGTAAVSETPQWAARPAAWGRSLPVSIVLRHLRRAVPELLLAQRMTRISAASAAVAVARVGTAYTVPDRRST